MENFIKQVSKMAAKKACILILFCIFAIVAGKIRDQWSGNWSEVSGL